MSEVLRDIDTNLDGNIAFKVAALEEVTGPDGTYWLYYTLGADLAAKLDLYSQHGWTLGDPELTGLYAQGFPIHRRQIVKRDKGPSAEQALADADGENDFPRFMANAPVAYTRRADGQEWLVFSKGPHMRQALDELWTKGKAVVKVESTCLDADGAPLLYQGKRVYKRLVVSKDSKHAVKPDLIQ